MELGEVFEEACRYGNLGLIKLCVKHGADIYAWDNWAVRCAAGSGNLDAVKYFVEKHGADITACDNFAVIWAAENGHRNIIKYLVEKGADVTASNNYAVRLAAANGHQHVVEYIKSITK